MFSVRSEVRRVHPVVGEMIVLPSATRPDTHTLLVLPHLKKAAKANKLALATNDRAGYGRSHLLHLRRLDCGGRFDGAHRRYVY